jgi:hypothetical protein
LIFSDFDECFSLYLRPVVSVRCSVLTAQCSVFSAHCAVFGVQCSEFRKNNNTKHGYIDPSVCNSYRNHYKKCIRMLNGLDRSLDTHLAKPEYRRTVNSKGHAPES